jgi:hypothetical protein
MDFHPMQSFEKLEGPHLRSIAWTLEMRIPLEGLNGLIPWSESAAKGRGWGIVVHEEGIGLLYRRR